MKVSYPKSKRHKCFLVTAHVAQEWDGNRCRVCGLKTQGDDL